MSNPHATIDNNNEQTNEHNGRWKPHYEQDTTHTQWSLAQIPSGTLPGGMDLQRYSLDKSKSPVKLVSPPISSPSGINDHFGHAVAPFSQEEARGFGGTLRAFQGVAGPPTYETSDSRFDNQVERRHNPAEYLYSQYPTITFTPSPANVEENMTRHAPTGHWHDINGTFGVGQTRAPERHMAANWESPSPTSTCSRTSSSLKATSSRTRTRIAPRNQHHQYLDSLLRSKCPKDRMNALDIAIQFRNEHNPDELIPNELLDELLEPTDGDKFYCFCCPRARKARTVTPARDHVRKSLGNFPFQCPNIWCRHSSLRQADLNKHMRTCTEPTVP